MEHRHITTAGWTFDAIDSVLERGGLADWRELLAAAKVDKRIAERIVALCEKEDHGGASVLARELAIRLWPELAVR